LTNPNGFSSSSSAPDQLTEGTAHQTGGPPHWSHEWLEWLATEGRIAQGVFKETWGGLRRTGWMNLIIIVTMASILSIFGTMLAFVLETQMFMDNIGSGLKISVYLEPDTALTPMVGELQKLPNVKSVRVISKEAAWEDMRQVYDVPEIQNPLPDTIHVQMADQRYIEPTVVSLKNMQGVEHVSYAQGVLRKLQKLARASSFIGLGVSIFLGTLTLFIISNTIHLLIEARSREIEILRMMGVGNGYIRLPFLLQGATYGLVGATIAFVPLAFAEHYITELFRYFQFATSGLSQNFVLTVMVLLGIGVGSLGSWLSVRRFLRV
jgi:cell division transport system permease protein